jgi:peroxiredoxin
MINKKILLFALILVLIGGGFCFSNVYTSSNKNTNKNSTPKLQNKNTNNSQSKEEKAPNFKLKDITGNQVSLSDYRGKKNVYLNFWATWCPPCKAEMPDIEKLYQQTKNSNLVILAVNAGEPRDTVKSFMKKSKYNFKALVDSDGTVSDIYSVISIPRSIFIDKNGYIKASRIGAISKQEMDDYIKMLK